MVYKKYIKRGGKRFGPYYYESYRGRDGKVKTKYLSSPHQNSRKGIFLVLLACFLLISVFVAVLVQTELITRESFYKVSDVGGSFYERASSVYESLYSNIAGFVVSEEPEETGTEETEEIQPDEIEEPETEETETEPEETEELGETKKEIEILIPPIPDINETNETEINETIANQTIANQTITNITEANETAAETIEEPAGAIMPNATLVNETITNITEADEETAEAPVNVSITTKQYKAVIGRPVKWIKTVKAPSAENLTLKVPKEAENITIRTGAEIQEALSELKKYEQMIKQADREDIKGGALTGMVSMELKRKEGILTKFWHWLLESGLTGKVIGKVIEEQEIENEITETGDSKIIDLENIPQIQGEEIAVEYYTDAPTATEERISGGKRVIVSAPSGLHYTDVLAYAEINTSITLNQSKKIRLYWNNVTETRTIKQRINFDAYDLNEDGFVDYIEWVVPHLSEQVYDIIYITNAEHLNEDRNFISNIYPEVKEKDGVWSETIPNRHYVRITFERNLTNKRDITIYARAEINSEIEVYIKDGSEVIARFENVQEERWYKVYLTGMQGNHDAFDLRVLGAVEFDYIIDPEISECLVLDTEGATYTLAEGGISNDALEAPCLNVTAADVTIDCIDLNRQISSTSNVAGIYSDQARTIIKNCNIDMGASGKGIHLDNSDDSEVYDNFLNDQGVGLYLNGADNVNVENLTASSNDIGVQIVSGGGNTLTNITSNSNGETGGIVLDGTTNNLIQRSNLDSNPTGIYIDGSSNNNNLTDCNISRSGGSDVDLASGTNIILLNVSYSSENVYAGAELIRKWYYRAYVNNTGGDNIEDANITAFNRSNNYQFNLTTDATGYTSVGSVIDYVNTGGTKIHYSNYTIYAEKTGYPVMSHPYNVTVNENNLKDVFTIGDEAPPEITIESPEGLNYSVTSLEFNISSNENLSFCNFTLDSWAGAFVMTRFNDTYFNYTNSTLLDGTYTAQFSCNDTNNNTNNTESVTFVIDNTFPLIDFGVNTLNNSARVWQRNVYVNVSVTETNFVNITFKLYNSTFDLINSTNYSAATYTMNWTSLSFGDYYYNVSVCDVVHQCNETASRKITLIGSQWNVTLNSGWNLISFSLNETDAGKDKNISINAGWNLIGYSSGTALDLNSSTFTNSSGDKFTWTTAVSNGKFQPYFVYYDSFNATTSERKYKYVATSDLSLDDTHLRQNYGYWLYANESGNLTLTSVGGSLSNATYGWSRLRFMNSSGIELNITEAGNSTNGWVVNMMYYWSTSENDFEYLPAYGNNIYSWKGYFIWSNHDNITLIRQN